MPCSVWYLSFQEEHLSKDWGGNLDSSIGKSARLVIWRSEVRIPLDFSLENLIIIIIINQELKPIISRSVSYLPRLINNKTPLEQN